MSVSFFPDSIWSLPPPAPGRASHVATEDRVWSVVSEALKRLPGYVIGLTATLPFVQGFSERFSFAMIGSANLLWGVVLHATAHAIEGVYEVLTDPSQRSFFRWAERIVFLVQKISYAAFLYMSGSVVLHEMGHALVSRLLFQNANPVVTVSYLAGLTTASSLTLSSLGARIGMQAALSIRAAAGVGVEIIYNLGLLFLAHQVKDRGVTSDLYAYVATNITAAAFYALTALWTTAKTNDFAILYELSGIHPVAAAVMIVAIPLLFNYTLDRLGTFALPERAN